MSQPSPPIFFITGPTAVGKSDIAAAVAAECDGEIISADAFQIYEGMDILTAKPSPETLAKAPHHLIGTVPLSQRFDVAQYREAALRVADEIRSRGKVPIVAGGTGLYIRALTHGLSDLPPSDHVVRAELEKLTLEELQRRYADLDPKGADNIDSNNRRRLVRAIEVCQLTGKPFSSFRTEWEHGPQSPVGVLLTRDRDDLHHRIDERVVAMFRAGLLAEVRHLSETGQTASQAIGLREALACLRGEIPESKAIELIQAATRQYAKRQLTWFRRETIFTQVNLMTFSHCDAAVRLISQQARDFFSRADV